MGVRPASEIEASEKSRRGGNGLGALLVVGLALALGAPGWEYLGIVAPVSGESLPAPPAGQESVYPTRLALGSGGKIYVSDARAGAVFIYDAQLHPIGVIDGLDHPLGVAVGPDGSVFVGNDGSDNVIVFDNHGVKTRVIGHGTVKMPNDLAVDRRGRLYVADSLSDRVWIYDTDGSLAASVGTSDNRPGRLAFPAALAIAYPDEGADETGELYVADQGHASIQVFDLQGTFLRAYGGKATRAGLAWDWQGRFTRIQSLALDAYGRLHAADSGMNRVQILDAVTGEFIDAYGEFGTAAGQLNLPLDILVRNDQVIVANAENGRVEVVYTIP